MNEFGNLVPLITAIISATALLIGYGYQKHLEKKAAIRKTRQEIYSRLITSITKRNEIMGRVMITPEWKKAKDAQEQNQLLINNPELSSNWHDRTEIVAFLCLYGTDDSIEAYSNWTKEEYDPNGKGGDFGKLVVALRKAIYPKTLTSPDEANMIIWGVETTHTSKKSSQAR
jgi:hypothetical protein